MTTMTKTLRYGKGYAGALSNKCWVAEITGSSSTYGLQRVFLEPTKVEREHFNRPRTLIYFSYELAANRLYELSAEGDRWFAATWQEESGEVVSGYVSDERAKVWAAALDEGKTNIEARQASKEA